MLGLQPRHLLPLRKPNLQRPGCAKAGSCLASGAKEEWPWMKPLPTVRSWSWPALLSGQKGPGTPPHLEALGTFWNRWGSGGRCASSSTLGAPSTSQSDGERVEGGPCGDQRGTRATTSSSSTTPGGLLSPHPGGQPHPSYMGAQAPAGQASDSPFLCTGEAEAGEGQTWIPGLEAAGWSGGEAVQHPLPLGERCPRRTLFSTHVQEPPAQEQARPFSQAHGFPPRASQPALPGAAGGSPP